MYLYDISLLLCKPFSSSTVLLYKIQINAFIYTWYEYTCITCHAAVHAHDLIRTCRDDSLVQLRVLVQPRVLVQLRVLVLVVLLFLVTNYMQYILLLRCVVSANFTFKTLSDHPHRHQPAAVFFVFPTRRKKSRFYLLLQKLPLLGVYIRIFECVVIQLNTFFSVADRRE